MTEKPEGLFLDPDSYVPSSPIQSSSASSDNSTVLIAVMGATGCGKSTFINLVSRSNLLVSDRLESCTQAVQTGKPFRVGRRLVTLIDTPGFDDTDRSEVEILKLIAGYLENQYQQRTKLHGILYFHRISDNRMGGISKRSFNLFRELCGDMTLKNVVIVTTMWDKVTLEEGEAREEQLSTNERFFRPALDQKAIMLRHDNTFESARNMIQMIFANHPLPLFVQKELVDDKILLSETRVGKALTLDLQKSAQQFTDEMRSLQAEIAEATREKDEKGKQELTDALLKSIADLARLQNEMKNMRRSTVVDVNIERQWKKMPDSCKLATLYRRSQGTPETPEMDSFWSALGDTTKAVSDISSVFRQYPLPLGLQEKLLKNASAPDEDAHLSLKAWIKEHSEGFKVMRMIMESTIRNKAKHRRWFFRRWTW